jgi:hypothetical protein
MQHCPCGGILIPAPAVKDAAVRGSGNHDITEDSVNGEKNLSLGSFG